MIPLQAYKEAVRTPFKRSGLVYISGEEVQDSILIF
jgi:hypothetical protein